MSGLPPRVFSIRRMMDPDSTVQYAYLKRTYTYIIVTGCANGQPVSIRTSPFPDQVSLRDSPHTGSRRNAEAVCRESACRYRRVATTGVLLLTPTMDICPPRTPPRLSPPRVAARQNSTLSCCSGTEGASSRRSSGRSGRFRRARGASAVGSRSFFGVKGSLRLRGETERESLPLQMMRKFEP